ncbi:MAG: ribosomal protein methylthiotransferase accessory factor [Gaiellaceae bacterium]|jgi:ribosomal protein S12 methylthiotransferase accessory factor|nr:ribosomal protein methylthiotransferase accessory factor [Gaiellaceae bacterium]MDX6492114.1 ribosomal protein methylthiotransferase accessory factor [Gaiellaceae bacterium]
MSAVISRCATQTSLPESLARLRTLVSPYWGLVRGHSELSGGPDDARLVRVGCLLADLEPLIGFTTDFRAGGCAPGRDEALAAALGEVAERYSASWLPEGLPLATARELGPPAVDPARFVLFHPRQYARARFPFKAFTADTRVRWVPAVALPSNEPAYLPAQLVYLRWRSPEDAGEEPIAYSTSNGTACGATFEEAVLSGLLELIERDAFMLTWYGRLSLPRLDWSSAPELVAFDDRYFRASGLAYSAIDLSCFHDVPTVVGIVRGTTADGAPLAVGAAAASTVGAAWQDALGEAFAVRAWARAMSHEGRVRRFADDFSDLDGFDDHIRFYANPEHATHAAFLDASLEERAMGEVLPLEGEDVTSQIEALCRRLAARGVTAYAVDVTAPDIADAGLRVAKVVAPELQPLDVAYDARYLGGARLYRAAFELGLRGEPATFDDVNPYPHPFP